MNDTSFPRDTSIAGPGRPAHDCGEHHWLDQLASWLERRLDETVGWQHSSRLYGITVIDRESLIAGTPDGNDAARVTYLAQGWVYDLLDSPSAGIATEYDALGLCCFGRATHLETLERSRCRTVLVADSTGQSCVNRLRGRTPELTGRPSGPVADRVSALFEGQRATEARRRP